LSGFSSFVCVTLNFINMSFTNSNVLYLVLIFTLLIITCFLFNGFCNTKLFKYYAIELDATMTCMMSIVNQTFYHVIFRRIRRMT
ncbi:hypothetical protein L9F63_022228, partial [Diploptera punctata]